MLRKRLLAQTHIAANPSNFLICLHCLKEFEQRGFLGFEPTINENAVFRVELFTESTQKPQVRVEFSAVFELHTVEHVEVFLIENVFFFQRRKTQFMFKLVQDVETIQRFFHHLVHICCCWTVFQVMTGLKLTVFHCLYFQLVVVQCVAALLF